MGMPEKNGYFFAAPIPSFPFKSIGSNPVMSVNLDSAAFKVVVLRASSKKRRIDF